MLRSRAAVWIGALLAAGALALAACSDDAQQEAEQGGEAQQQAAVESEPQAAAAAQPAQAAQQQAAAAGQQSGSAAQAAEQSVQSAAQQAERSGGAEGGAPPADSEQAAQLEAVQALYDGWAAALTSFVLEFDIATEVNGQRLLEQSFMMQAQLEPLALHYQIELPPWLAGMMDDGSQADAADAQAAGSPTAPLTDILFIDNSVYISLPEEGGWFQAPLDQSSDAELTEIFGSGRDSLDSAFLGRAALLCAELTGAAVTEGERGGRAAWVVVCEADAATFEAVSAALAAAGQTWPRVLGAPPDGEGIHIESMAATVWIDQQEGAALGYESAMMVRGDASAADNSADGYTVTTVGRTLSWNQPLDLPTPEPLLEDPDSGAYE